MRAISRFSLAQHDGPYDTWPLKTPLLLDGQPTGTRVPGYTIFAQLALDDGYLLVTDHDCPFEEMYEVVLLDRDLRVRSRASEPARWFVGAAVAAGAIEVPAFNLFCGTRVLGPRQLLLLGCTQPPHLEITVRERRPWGIGPLIRLRRVSDDRG